MRYVLVWSPWKLVFRRELNFMIILLALACFYFILQQRNLLTELAMFIKAIRLKCRWRYDFIPRTNIRPIPFFLCAIHVDQLESLDIIPFTYQRTHLPLVWMALVPLKRCWWMAIFYLKVLLLLLILYCRMLRVIIYFLLLVKHFVILIQLSIDESLNHFLHAWLDVHGQRLICPALRGSELHKAEALLASMKVSLNRVETSCNQCFKLIGKCMNNLRQLLFPWKCSIAIHWLLHIGSWLELLCFWQFSIAMQLFTYGRICSWLLLILLMTAFHLFILVV